MTEEQRSTRQAAPQGDGADDATQAAWAEEAVREHEEIEAEEVEESAGHPHKSREQQVLDRIERARRRKPRLRDAHITMSHGAGGKSSQSLTEAVFLEAFRNPALERLEDQAMLSLNGHRLAFTTDSFVVSPIFFPGGNIGDLAINGTVNDLAVGGATPKWLSASFVLEEGFPVDDLRRIVTTMREAADAAGVEIVTGDTKVVGQDKGDGCYINTAGIGVMETDVVLGAATVQPGDAVLVSGPIGEHGITVMLARGELDIEADLESDTAPLHELTASLLEATEGVRCMRDATRGGVATVLNEIAQAADVAVVLNEAAVPMKAPVAGASEVLGIDPLYVACEGRMVVVVDPAEADAALEAMRQHPLGAEATRVGTVKDDPAGLVLLNTTFGGTRIVDLLVGDPLPRIC